MQLINALTSKLAEGDLEVLQSLPLFSVASEAEFESICAALKKRRYSKGAVIYHQDDPPGSIFFVVDGAVRMERAFDNGRQHTIGWVTRGGFFGTHSVFGVVPRTENAIVVSPCELLVLGGNDFRDFLHRNPAAMEAFLRVVMDKWRGCLDRFSETILLNVRERTIRVLVRLTKRLCASELDGSVYLSDVTQHELASWVGASRESVNRALRSLVHMGLIRLDGGKVCVIDAGRLAKFDPATD
jgi:CRP/FNR family transcriptional regulator, cyclic AMP receptor protein